MKTLKITHFFDVIKKEITRESQEAATSIRTNGTALEIKIKQEFNIKEEIDIPWDEKNDTVDKGNTEDNIYSSEKYITIFNPRVILDKLPNSIVQKYVKCETNHTDIHENSTKLRESDIIPEKLTAKYDRNVSNKKLRNKSNLNKTDDNCHDSQFYWKTCTTCKKRHEIVRNKRKMHECQKCKTRLIYECKKCHRQLTTPTGIKYHMMSKCVNRGYYFKCFECDYKGANKGSVLCHVRVKHPTMTSQMHSRIVKIECENVQSDLDKAKHKCSKCEKRFEFLPNLMRHIQICTGMGCKTNNKNQSLVDLETVRDRIILYCKKCDYELMYNNCIEGKNSIENVKLCKKKCLHCKSTMIFKCAECRRQFTSRHGIAGHIRAIHNTKQIYKCSECDYMSHVLVNLANHYRLQHISEIHECSKCSAKFNNRYNFNKHLHECGLQPGYNCEHCSYKSHYRGNFINHIRGRHLAVTTIDCPKCKHTFKNKICLNVHLSICGKPLVLQCDHCSFKTKYRSALTGHSLRMHSTGSEIECPNCKKMQRNGQCLKDHLRYCNRKDDLQCDFCSYKTRYPSSLRSHALRLHGKSNDSCSSIRQSRSSCSNQANYQCDHCSYKTKIKRDIYQHIVMRHLQEKNIECQRCNTKFQNSVYLNTHLNYCGFKPYLYCDQCPFKTYLKGQLTAHMERKHMSFECAKCKRTFKRKDNLQTHLNRVCRK